MLMLSIEEDTSVAKSGAGHIVLAAAPPGLMNIHVGHGMFAASLRACRPCACTLLLTAAVPCSRAWPNWRQAQCIVLFRNMEWHPIAKAALVNPGVPSFSDCNKKSGLQQITATTLNQESAALLQPP